MSIDVIFYQIQTIIIFFYKINNLNYQNIYNFKTRIETTLERNDDYYIEIDNKKYDKTKIKDYQIFKKFIDNFDFGYIGRGGAEPFNFDLEL